MSSYLVHLGRVTDLQDHAGFLSWPSVAARVDLIGNSSSWTKQKWYWDCDGEYCSWIMPGGIETVKLWARALQEPLDYLALSSRSVGWCLTMKVQKDWCELSWYIKFFFNHLYLLLLVYKDGLFTGESIVLVHQISFIMSVDKPYLPQLCSPADPKVALNSLE